MENKFTKGEWAWQKFGTQYLLTAQHGMREIIIGTVKDNENTMLHSVATNIEGRLQPITPDNPNAKLIASAPELLHIIMEADAWFSINTHPSANEIANFRRSLQEIIKKATD